MAYEAKTDWLPDTEIREDDLNRWEQGIDDAHNELDSHKKDQTNPHRVTKKQVGLGNVDDVQQASKLEFERHRDNINNPHKVNSTQVNVITAKDAAANYSEYPTGITIAETGTGKSMGYPWDFILIETEQLGANRTVQTIYDMSSSTVIRSMVRKYREADGGWGDWAKTETEAAAQEKADKAESNAKNASVPRTGGTMSGDLILENNKKISHKSPSGEVRRTIHRGGDDNVYINTDNIGKTVLRGARVVNKDDKDVETTEGAQAKADTVKSYVQQYGLGVAARSGIDWDALSNSGFYSGSTNGPISSVVIGMHIQHGSAYAYQIAGRRGEFWFRTKENGDWSPWDKIESTEDAQKKANDALVAAKSYTDDHKNNKSNPHNVTKAQVGLGNVDNAKQATKSEFDNHTGNKNNPHGVNTTQVNVIASKPATDNVDSYPTGVSTFPVNSDPTYPSQLGTVTTFKHNQHRAFQFFVEKSGLVYYRTADGAATNQWNDFIALSSATDAQQRATQAESNAINDARSYGLGSDGLQELMNLNDASKTGWRSFGSNAVNAPRAANGVVETILSGPNDGIQKAYLTGSRVEFLRRKEAGTWSSWIQTAGNQEEGWRELTPRGGSQIYSEAAKPMVMRQGDMVMVRGALTGINSRGFLALTLPGDCRPAKDTPALTNISIGSDYHARFARWTIKTNGDIIMEYTIDNTFDARWWSVEMVFSMGG